MGVKYSEASHSGIVIPPLRPRGKEAVWKVIFLELRLCVKGFRKGAGNKSLVFNFSLP